jgi:hypothetical protein
MNNEQQHNEIIKKLEEYNKFQKHIDKTVRCKTIIHTGIQGAKLLENELKKNRKL